MDYLDKLVPLTILIVVGAMLMLLLRWSAREKELRGEEVASAGVTSPVLPPMVAEPVESVSAIEVVPSPAVERRRKERAVKQVPTATPIHAVLELLKKKDTLAAAFILHEILDAPVSKRQ